jgi:amino acid transporter
MVWLMRPGACAADSISFGQFTIYSFTGEYSPDYSWVARVLAFFCIAFTTFIHGYAPKIGIIIQDALTMLKISVLIFTIIIGILAAAQVGSLRRADENFTGPFNSGGVDASSFASAFLQMSFAYDGWNNINYSLDELIDPVKSLPIVSLTSISIVSFLYIFATLSFFLVVPVSTITGPNMVIAADMFKIALGDFWGQRFMPFLIGLSSFGSVMCMAFGVSRVTLSAAKEGYFPFLLSNHLGKLNSKNGPMPALVLNFIVTLALILVPSQSAYEVFFLDSN